LQDYQGALIVVSHDRHLLRTVTDEFLLVAEGRAQPFDGDLDDYRDWLNERQRAANGTPRRASQATATARSSAATRSGRKRNAASSWRSSASRWNSASGSWNSGWKIARRENRH
jgi:ATP-binding cassette subfamily F protein 3